MNIFTNIRRKLLYLAFLLLAGVAPAYTKNRIKKRDKNQSNKETLLPWDNLKIEVEQERGK